VGGKKKKAKAPAPSSASLDPLYLEVLDTHLMDTLLGSLLALYRNLPAGLVPGGGEESQQQQDEEEEEETSSAARVEACFADGGIGLMLATIGARSASARMSLIHLSALLPDRCSPDLHEISLPHLLSLSPSADGVLPHAAEWAPILECLVAWQRTEELLAHMHRAMAFGFRHGVEAFEHDGEKSNQRKQIKREFDEEYQLEHAELLRSFEAAAGGKKKKSKKGRSAAAASSAPTLFDSSTPLMHPLMAAKYLLFLLEHDKTRAAVLARGVEWTAPNKLGEVDHAAGAMAAGSVGQGRAVGFLAAVMTLFEQHLIPACKALVEDGDASMEAPVAMQAHMAFLQLALQADLKTGLHIHARIKLMAGRADQLALEAAQEAATAALVDQQDGAEAAPVVPVAPAANAAASVPAFPSNVQPMLDFTSYILLPHWTALVDRPQLAHAAAADAADAGEEAEPEHKNEHEEAASEESASSKNKKAKKTSGAAAATAGVPASLSSSSSSFSSSCSVSSLGSFLSSHLSFVARFTTELGTLGLFSNEVGLRHFQAWMTHFNDMAAKKAVDEAKAMKEAASAKAKESKPRQLFGPQTAELVGELIPLAFKTLYQLSVVARDTRSFGTASGVDELLLSSSASSELSFHAYASFWRSALSLLACSGSEQTASLVAASPLLKAGLIDSLAQFDRVPTVQARGLLTVLDSLVDDDEVRFSAARLVAQPDWLLPLEPVASTADLSPFALLLLTAVARSPSCVGALPRTLDLLAERLAVQSPANEQRIVARMATAFAALASLADVHVKMPTSQ
jgi:hypothetical protein